MNTTVVTVDKEHPDAKVMEEAGRVLKEGGLVAFPTETVYGLGGDGLNPDSSRKIYQAKGRPSDNPLIIPHLRLPFPQFLEILRFLKKLPGHIFSDTLLSEEVLPLWDW